LFEKNSAVRNIQIPSNGFLVERTVARAEETLKKTKRARISTGVSLDGPEEIHNRIRQNPQSFERAVLTFRELKKLKPQYPNLSVGVALTVSSANQGTLDDFFRFLTEDLSPDAITITLARGNPMDPSLKSVDLQVYREFSQKVIRYRRENQLTQRWADHLVVAKEEESYRLINQAAAAEKRISPCYAGELIGILSETGEVFLCETLDRSMGNVRDFEYDFGRLWKSSQALNALRYQKELKCQCTYECAMSVNALFNPTRALRIAGKAVGSKFLPQRH
jgi:MoaA/NifB/PqqE/SkfB family radical SAM enzyme